jgi:hypothetical protein
MPASCQLFEQVRDSIEIQRQAKNVYGVVSRAARYGSVTSNEPDEIEPVQCEPDSVTAYVAAIR